MTLTELRDRLKLESQVVDSESVTDEMIEGWLTEAISSHNDAYDSEGADLPVREVPLVLLLAKIELCVFRANSWVNQNDLSGTQGFGQDRNTPFAKNMKLAEGYREIYDKKCADMGLTPNPDGDTSTIVQGTLTKVDPEIDARTPFRKDPTRLRPVVLTMSELTATSVVLAWTKSKDDVFIEYILFYAETAATLHQVWNVESTTGIPEVADVATLIRTISNPDVGSVKITGLEATKTYHFLVVVRNANRKYVYSNDLAVTTPS